MSAPSLKVQIQGVTSVSADNLNTYQQTCDIVAELRGFVGAEGVQVSVRGLTAPNDGGAGDFYWDASAIGPDDGINVIVPTGSALGAWVRISVSIGIITPESFGARGNGVTDDTAAWNRMLAYVNTNPVYPIWLSDKARYFVAGSLTPITAANVKIFGNGATILAKPDTWAASGGGTSMLSVVSGANNFSAQDLIFNGNQSNFSAQPGAGGQLFSITNVDYPQLTNVAAINSPALGVNWDTVGYGSVSNCHFDKNANLGWQRASCSYTKITNTTRNYNGYGFKNTWATNAFVAFGEAVRFQCFNEIDIAGQALFNGRDGFNQNQGSHHNVFIGSIANGNGDGGFTMAADNTSAGRPGNSESPYSLKYIGVEAIANWSSGLVAYSMTDDIEYSGRFANNCRLAGSIALASSTGNGVYFAAGSTNLHPVGETVAFDDRQVCPITVISGSGSTRVLTATNWTAGWSALYKTVSFYNANMTFEGYGFITAESPGSVTIEAAAQNAVTLSSIATTWYVSQCTQVIGVFYDNNCQGEMNVAGYGHKSNASFGGSLIFSGPFANGQNVLLRNGAYGGTQLLLNPTFDTDTSSNWTYNLPGGGSASQVTSGNVLSAGALQLTAGAGQNAEGDATLVSGSANYGGPNGFFLEFSGWVYSSIPAAAALTLYWNNEGNFTTADHPGGGWKFLRIGIFNNDTNGIDARVQALNGNTVYFDNLSLLAVAVSSAPSDFQRPAYLNSLTSAPLYPVPPT